MFFLFRVSYILCIYVMNILCTFRIFMYGYVTLCPFKIFAVVWGGGQGEVFTDQISQSILHLLSFLTPTIAAFSKIWVLVKSVCLAITRFDLRLFRENNFLNLFSFTSNSLFDYIFNSLFFFRSTTSAKLFFIYISKVEISSRYNFLVSVYQ